MQIAFSKLIFATLAAAVFIVANLASGKKVSAGGRYLVGWILVFAFILPANIPLLRVEIPENRAEQMFIGGEANGEQHNFPTVKPPLPSFSESEPEPAPGEPTGQNAKAFSFPAEAAVWSVYALGAFITLFCTFYRYCRAVKSLQRCGRAPSERENEIYLRLCKKHRLRKAPVLLVCPAFVTGSSITFGFFRQVVLIADKFKEEDYALILEHELTHCKRKDSLFKAVLSLLGALYWFNPIMHLFIREMHDLCEQSCDEKLLKNSDFDERERYCILLIETACARAGNKNMVSAFKGGKKTMKKRIENILNKKSRIITALVLVTVVLVAALTSAIYIDTPPENIKVAYFTEPQQMRNLSWTNGALGECYSDKFFNVDYDYSVDSNTVKISGVVNGIEFKVEGDFVTPAFNGSRLAYRGTDTLGNYNVKSIMFKVAQKTEYTEVPIQDHNSGDKASAYYYGWFYEYARENPQYKNVLYIALNPVDTDDIVIMEIFMEEDFIRDFIKSKNLTYADVDNEADYEICCWDIAWYREHQVFPPKD